MAAKILASYNPVQQKKLGRQVRNFDEQTWTDQCRTIVKDANRAKFSQYASLLDTLRATKGTILVEASPRDRIWGIGLGVNNPKALRKTKWRGKNWLGYILTELREELCAET